LAVNEISNCFTESFPMDWWDLGEYSLELMVDPNAPFLGISHDFFSWASSFSNCSNEVKGYQMQAQMQIAGDFSDCVQPYNCGSLVNCGY
jgi:hypothetical protein